MPELPEVETTRRGLCARIEKNVIESVVLRHHTLRYKLQENLHDILKQQTIHTIIRRGKYLIFTLDTGALIIHLGMSGTLRLLPTSTPLKTHDHVDINLSTQHTLRYNDPRRFGCIIWTPNSPLSHQLIQVLGVEPLEDSFTADYLFKQTTKRRMPIKSLLMDSHVVVGVGNIYATEALFLSRIDPRTEARYITHQQCQLLIKTIKSVLLEAINQGGTTLKDFVASDGKPGYFSQQLHVYGRKGLPCTNCQSTLVNTVLGGRASVFCPVCQPEMP